MKIFCRIKSGRVATDELAAVLDSMDIPVIPETFQEVIKHASIDSELFELLCKYIFLGYQCADSSFISPSWFLPLATYQHCLLVSVVRDSLEKLNEKFLKLLDFGMFDKNLREKCIYFLFKRTSLPCLVCGEMVSLMSRALASQTRRPKFLEFLTLLDSFDYTIFSCYSVTLCKM